MQRVKSIADMLVFGNFYIAGAAVAMCYYTYHVLYIPAQPKVLWFVFFSTVSSYNLHWALTPAQSGGGERIKWTLRYKDVLIAFFLLSLPFTLFFFYSLRKNFLWIAIPASTTFLYTAPKIPFIPFIWLRRFVIGKTLYLTIVWTYITVAMPLILSGGTWKTSCALFFANRFFLILPICMLLILGIGGRIKKAGLKI